MSNSVPPKNLPTADQLLIPTVNALRALGGSASTEELSNKTAEILGLSDEVIGYRREGAGMNAVAHRATWTRSYLKQAGVFERTERGLWALTPLGRDISDSEIASIPARLRRKQTENRATETVKEDVERDETSETGVVAVETEVVAEQTWKEKLLALLLELPPAAFERLAQRILRESGFSKVVVSGKTGDGGIDGSGVLRIQLISFHVLFQCKRYRETVGASAIRDLGVRW